MERKKLAVFGLGARGNIYARFAKKYPEKFDLTAIIENNPERMENAKTSYPGTRLFSDYRDFIEANIGGHMGGDYFMLNSLHKALNGEAAEGITYLDVSIESHLMSFAAEESRLDKGSSIKI